MIHPNLSELLRISTRHHSHLCPRQVLGVRIGLAGVAAVGLVPPVQGRRLLVIVETDGCFVDGVLAAAPCSVGKRTLRVEDYGKVAATFVDVTTERALRIAPRLDVRERALAYAPGESRRYFAQLAGYQNMPDDELLSVEPVQLTPGIAEIVSRAGLRVECALCGEEIMNQREVVSGGQVLCRPCALGGYYRPAENGEAVTLPGLAGQRAVEPVTPIWRHGRSGLSAAHHP